MDVGESVGTGLVSPGPGPENDPPAVAGMGVPCPEAQADGVPCAELGIPCEECERAVVAELLCPEERRITSDAPRIPAGLVT